ncbi:MAG TPA: DUF2723 domain-containing protein [Candidatus Udaeobacter sp.]|nr:DUF2723 domain-containing protein [Candidatus Udaeobacter sp.]
MARGLSKNIQPHNDKTKLTTPDSNTKPDRKISVGSVRWARVETLCALVVFIAALLLYSRTLAPTVTVTDSGELIVVAQGLGVGHPPGVPLWTILAHLASLVPFGNVAQRINFSSALFAAMACAVLTLAVVELMIAASFLVDSKREKKGMKRSKNAEDSNIAQLLVVAPAVGAGLLMAFSRTLWSYATITEVYALNTLLITFIFFLILRWRRRVVADSVEIAVAKGAVRGVLSNTTHDALLYAAALVFGLALGVHHVTVAMALPAVAVVVYRTQGARFFVTRRLVYAALISIGALIAIYAYLPFAASRSPVINWGHPRSLQEIWWHITGRQYQVYFSFTPAIIGKQFGEFCRMALREFGFFWLPLAVVLACVGFIDAFKRDRTTFWFLSTIVVANLAYALSYEIAEDKDAYYLPIFIALAIAAGVGIRWLIRSAISKSSQVVKPSVIAATAVVLVGATAVSANWPFDNRRNNFIAHDYVENLFRSVEPNGLLLTLDWQVASPMFYAQTIEHRRRDVKVIDINLLRRSWYFDYLKADYPSLVQRSGEEIEAFMKNLKEWEADPGRFAKSPALTQGISATFLKMIQSIITNESKIAPVYMTSDLLSSDSVNGELTRWITQKYQLVPRGLVFNLSEDRNFHDLPDVPLQTRGLADGTLRFENDDVVKIKILPAYARMLTNRGRYLELFNQHDRAAKVFREALVINPGLIPAQQGLADSTAKMRNQ